MAARIVNKQRRQYGETKKANLQERKGTNPDRDLPIDRYRHLTVGQIDGKLDDLSKRELRQVQQYEKSHKNRKTLLAKLEDRLA